MKEHNGLKWKREWNKIAYCLITLQPVEVNYKNGKIGKSDTVPRIKTGSQNDIGLILLAKSKEDVEKHIMKVKIQTEILIWAWC